MRDAASVEQSKIVNITALLAFEPRCSRQAIGGCKYAKFCIVAGTPYGDARRAHGREEEQRVVESAVVSVRYTKTT